MKVRQQASRGWAVLVAVLAARSVRAGDERAGAELLNFPPSVRQLGMGEVAGGGTDVLRAWGDPSALAGLQGDAEFAASGGMRQGALHTGGAVGAGWRALPRVVVGGILTTWGVSRPEVDENGDRTGRVVGQTVRSAGFPVGFSVGRWRAGLALKVVSEELVDESVTVAASDAGVAAEALGCTGSLVVRNLGPDLRPAARTAGLVEVLPLEVRLGAAWHDGAGRLVLAAEYLHTRGLAGAVRGGAEWWLLPGAALRAGGGAGTASSNPKVTAGLTVAWRQLALDYATGYSLGGLSHQASLTYALPARPVSGGPAAVPSGGGAVEDGEQRGEPVGGLEDGHRGGEEPDPALK